MSHLHICKVWHFWLLHLIWEVTIFRHSVLIVLDNTINHCYQFYHTFFFWDIKLLEIDQTEVVYNIYDNLIKLEELFGKEILFVHLVTDNILARRCLCDLLKKLFILDLVAFCQHINVWQAHLHHSCDWCKTSRDVLGWLTQICPIWTVSCTEDEATFSYSLT